MVKEEDFIKFKKALLEPIPDYRLDMDTIGVIEEACKDLMRKKDKDYGGSWQQDGLLSVHMNLKRKFDRLHKLFLEGFNPSVEDETVLDTLIDLRNYTTLYIMFMVKKDTDYFDALLGLLRQPTDSE